MKIEKFWSTEITFSQVWISVRVREVGQSRKKEPVSRTLLNVAHEKSLGASWPRQ